MKWKIKLMLQKLLRNMILLTLQELVFGVTLVEDLLQLQLYLDILTFMMLRYLAREIMIIEIMKLTGEKNGMGGREGAQKGILGVTGT